jgi:Tetratricopeptide Repeats-Sensor/Adenylate and Guanylate cyclase catalytic domain
MTADDWRQQGERLLSQGAPILAYDTLADGLAAFPGDIRLRQLLGLALARSGAPRAAVPILERLRDEGHTDEETLGLLARAHKDLWAAATDAGAAERHLALAHDTYDEAHRASGGIWSGINAATTALLLGRKDDARATARAVRDRCRGDGCDDPARAGDYWQLATLAEANLILGDLAAAEDLYAKAAEIGRGRAADMTSTRRNARLIVRALGVDGSRIEHSLRAPRVIAFAGHLIDRPDRPEPRFPPALEDAAARAICERLQQLEAGFGYASAACGADILFLEALDSLQGETTIVLPYGRDQFEQDSVAIVPASTWPERYRRALERATDVVMASERRMGAGELSYEYANRLIDGLAALRADALDSEAVALVLWDRREGDGRGGTAATVEEWRRGGRTVEVIDLAELARGSGITDQGDAHRPSPIAHRPSAIAHRSSDAFEPQIVTMLFADAKGFSTLSEPQIPPFVFDFLGTVATRLAQTSHPPLLKNTWGDGLYFVFDNARDAGLFALDLAAEIATTDWSVRGLPREMSLRTGLHAGPAYACTDPVTGRLNYLGAHVSRAARIEPITPAGEVYATREFAAIARAERATGFKCEYVGRTPLAKGYGTAPMYVVRRDRFSAAWRSDT